MAAAQTGCSHSLACGKKEKGEREKERKRMNQKEQAITVSWCDSTQEALSAAPRTVSITQGKKKKIKGGWGCKCIVNKRCCALCLRGARRRLNYASL